MTHATPRHTQPIPSASYAAIDIGTVTCRLLIADVDADGLHEREKQCVITDLGEGVDASGYLSTQAMKRVVTQIARFQNIIASYQNDEHPHIMTIATATSAARDAKNSSEFLEMLKALGVELSIIAGEKEAALSFLGAASNYPNEALLVVDIGGGSTEIIAGRVGETEPATPSAQTPTQTPTQAPAKTPSQTPVKIFSFDIGCRRITERFLKSDPPTKAELNATKNQIAYEMRTYFRELKETGFVPERLIAVAGTATSVVSVHEKMHTYDSTKVHGTVVSKQTLQDVCHLLQSIPLAKRQQIVGLEPKRAGVIVAGLVILETVMNLAEQNSYTASESDLLQGIILNASQNK